METTTTEGPTESRLWVRALYMLFFALVYSLVEILIAPIAILQLLIAAITRKPSAALQRFGQSLSMLIYDILVYVTFASEKRPFPFQEWPSGKPEERVASAAGPRGADSPASDTLTG